MINLPRFQVETADTGISDGHRSSSNTPRIFIQSPTHISCLHFEARLGKDVTAWSPEEVKNWLKVAGFLDVVDDLYSHRVDGFGLTTLSHRVLTMMDIPPHRIFLLMDAISQLRLRTRELVKRRPPSPRQSTKLAAPYDECKSRETRVRASTEIKPDTDSKTPDHVLERMFSDSELIVLSRELANRVTLGRFTVTNDYFADEDMSYESFGYADDEDSESYDDAYFGLDKNGVDSGYYEEMDSDSGPTCNRQSSHSRKTGPKRRQDSSTRFSLTPTSSKPPTTAGPIAPPTPITTVTGSDRNPVSGCELELAEP